MAFTVINTMACTSIDLLTLLSKVTNFEIKCSFKINSNFLKVFPSQWISVNFFRLSRPHFFLPSQMNNLLIYINVAVKAAYTKEMFADFDEFLTTLVAYTLQA